MRATAHTDSTTSAPAELGPWNSPGLAYSAVPFDLPPDLGTPEDKRSMHKSALMAAALIGAVGAGAVLGLAIFVTSAPSAVVGPGTDSVPVVPLDPAVPVPGSQPATGGALPNSAPAASDVATPDLPPVGTPPVVVDIPLPPPLPPAPPAEPPTPPGGSTPQPPVLPPTQPPQPLPPTLPPMMPPPQPPQPPVLPPTLPPMMPPTQPPQPLPPTQPPVLPPPKPLSPDTPGQPGIMPSDLKL